MKYFRMLLRRFRMPYRKQLLDLCHLIAPHGSTLWTVRNGIRFQFYHGTTVWVSLENKQTGVITEVWDSDSGWRTRNEVLRQWFVEGVELLVAEYHSSKEAALTTQAAEEQALVDQFDRRFEQNKPSSME